MKKSVPGINVNTKSQKIEKLKEDIMLKVLNELEPFKNQLQESLQASMASELEKIKKDMEEKNKKILNESIKQLKKEVESNNNPINTNNQQTSDNVPNEKIQDILNEVKEDMNTHEENFEKVQQNFLKMNSSIGQLENNQKVLNEILVTLKNNFDQLLNNFHEKMEKIEKWQKNINDLLQKARKDPHQVSPPQNISKENKNPLLSSNFNIEEAKKEIEEQDQGENLLNSLDYLDNREVLVHGSGFISNKLKECVLKGEKKEQESTIKSSISDNNEQIIERKGKSNTLQISEKESKGNKLEKNMVYNMTTATELNEIDYNANFQEYLKKFIIPMTNYENVLEIEYDLSNQNSDNNNDNTDNDVYDFGNQNENIEEFDLESL